MWKCFPFFHAALPVAIVLWDCIYEPVFSSCWPLRVLLTKATFTSIHTFMQNVFVCIFFQRPMHYFFFCSTPPPPPPHKGVEDGGVQCLSQGHFHKWNENARVGATLFETECLSGSMSSDVITLNDITLAPRSTVRSLGVIFEKDINQAL